MHERRPDVDHQRAEDGALVCQHHLDLLDERAKERGEEDHAKGHLEKEVEVGGVGVGIGAEAEEAVTDRVLDLWVARDKHDQQRAACADQFAPSSLSWSCPSTLRFSSSSSVMSEVLLKLF